MANQQCDTHAERSSWWNRSWLSRTPWSSARNWDTQSHSHYCTISQSQSWSLTLAPTSTQKSSTTATPQFQLRIIVSTHTSGSSLDASTQTVQPNTTLSQDAPTQPAPHSASTKEASTQLSVSEFLQWCVPTKDQSRRADPSTLMSVACTVSATAVVTAALHLYHKHTLDSCHTRVLKYKISQVLRISSPPKQRLFAHFDSPVSIH